MNFKSLRSGSGGNAALLWTDTTAVLIDFAPGCQRDCRALLAAAKRAGGRLDAVLVTHAHGDHINRNSLKVLAEEGLPVHCHHEVCRQIKERHGAEYAGIIRPFVQGVKVGGLEVLHAQVDHVPGCYTTAFIISAGRDGHKASVFTDLSCFTEEHAELAADSDLLWLEANHDQELLRRFGHPGSEFHLSNLDASRFLHAVCARSRRQPQAVVLGHLSEDCNAPHLPELEIKSFFKERNCPVKFRSQVAPRSVPGCALTIK